MDVINTIINWIYSCVPHIIDEDTNRMPNCKCRQINQIPETHIEIDRTQYLLTPDMLERGIVYPIQN